MYWLTVAVSLLFAFEAITASQLTKLNYLSPEEQSCTNLRTGMVRYMSQHDVLQVCGNRRWKPYNPAAFTSRIRRGLIGHWRMDEQTGSQVADDSGHEHHANSSGAVPALAKFSRGRYFSGVGLYVIKVPKSPLLNFGYSSFTVSGWAKILDVTYPMTTFAVRKGFGCYLAPGRAGWNPGWEIAHGYWATGIDVCYRDHLNNKVRAAIVHDSGYQPPQLVNKWTHFTYVFDRHVKRVFAYINGRKQSNSLDISRVTGSVNNDKDLEFGTLYRWKTKGYLDEYRLFNFPLNSIQVKQLFLDHRV